MTTDPVMEMSILRSQLAEAKDGIELLKDLVKKNEEEIESLSQENSNLLRWKKQWMTIEAWWLEVDSFVRKMPQCGIGKHVSKECLRILKECAHQGWQPIATAPKDGTPILLLEKWSDEPFVGYWSTAQSAPGWTAIKSHLAAYGGWEGAVVEDNFSSADLTMWASIPKLPAF